jgi:predicted CxxxxCH...CXXCH cytochrome family protein
VDGLRTLSRTGCTLCHGDLTATGVPRVSALVAPGVNGNAADTTGAVAGTPGVGAHAAHLTGTRWRATPMACADCHTVPALNDVTHATGAGSGGARATTVFTGGLGTATGATYTGSNTAGGGTTAGSCASTYCHGNFTTGASSGLNRTVPWTATPAQAACGTCHANPPAGATHLGVTTTCTPCHDAAYTPTTVNPTLHLNGHND